MAHRAYSGCCNYTLQLDSLLDIIYARGISTLKGKHQNFSLDCASLVQLNQNRIAPFPTLTDWIGLLEERNWTKSTPQITL